MDFNSKYKSSEIEELLDKAGTAVQPDDLAAVAKSGSYNDLNNKPTIPAEQVNADWNATSGKAQILNKPTIPAAVTENTVSGWGFTKNTGTYSKPSTGIPKSDLASSVQTSLDKADKALQSYTEQYKGTVTGVKINGSTKSPSSGTVDIGNVVTSIKINGSTKNPSNGVVDLGTVLTAHQSLKTINGLSIVGSGNITISSGGGEQIEEPYVEEIGGLKYIMFDDVDTNAGHINTPMMPDVTYVCTKSVDAVILYNLQLPTGNVGKYTLHFVMGAEGGVIEINPDFYLYSPNGALNTALAPWGVYELSIVVTKMVESGVTSWIYKAVLTSFTY